MEFQLGGKKIGENNPTFIIAELSANHMNDFDIAVKTIEAMAESGADAVKFQTFTPDTITIDCDNEYFQIKQGTVWDGQVLHELYEDAYMPWDWQPKLKKIAEDLGLIVFSSPFDKTSVDFLEDMDVPAYKIASFEITDIPLIEYVASKGKPIIISTGIASIEDIELAVQTCLDAGNTKICLLKCTSSYPAPFEEINLSPMNDLDRKCRVPIKTFKSWCDYRAVADSDGIAYYATKDKITRLNASPRAFYEGYIRNDFKYVCWYNK